MSAQLALSAQRRRPDSHFRHVVFEPHAEEALFRAGGVAKVNPILDEHLLFLKGLESARAERGRGLTSALIEREDVKRRTPPSLLSRILGATPRR